MYVMYLYLVHHKHSNKHKVIVKREFPIDSDPGCPPNEKSKHQPHEHPRQVGFCKHIQWAGSSGEATV